MPPAFRLAGVELHAPIGWGSVTHWNAFVAVFASMGQERFPIRA
jgi:hypothetical protein